MTATETSKELLQNRFHLVTNFINQHGAVRHHLDSYNYFIESQLPRIIQDFSEERNNIHLSFSKVQIRSPHDPIGNKVFPQECRMRHMTYASSVEATVQVQINHITQFKESIPLFIIPVMLRSKICHLFNQSFRNQIEMNEDFMDPGAYFIINGTEKVVLMQEQTSNNRIIVTQENDLVFKATVTSQTKEIASTVSNVWLKNGRIFLSHNKFGRSLLNIFVIFKAMGFTADIETVNLISSDLVIQEILEQSLYECAQQEICSQKQALAYLTEKMDNRNQSVFDFLRQTLFAHIPTTTLDACAQIGRKLDIQSDTIKPEGMIDGEVVQQITSQKKDEFKQFRNDNFYPKAVFLAEIVKRLILTSQGKIQLTDRDFYGNKRLELENDIFSLIFEDAFKYQVDSVFKEFAKNKDIKIQSFKDFRHIGNIIIRSVSTGNVNIPRLRYERIGMSQLVSRYCYIGTLGQMTRLNSTFAKDMKSTGPRMLNGSQWGICCPSDTPEGESVGLTKNLSVLTTVSVKINQEILEKLLFQLGVEDINICNPNSGYRVFVNGVIIGIHSNLKFLLDKLRKLRRSGKIDSMISIYYESINKCVNINTDAGRCLRPLIIVKDGKSLISQHDITIIDKQLICFDDLVQQGKIEYIDVNEELNCYIAFSDYDLQFRQNYTHIEIDPQSILGFVCALVPFPHHNQSPRNVFQCAMGKQALGLPSLNIQHRFDSVLYQLSYPQRPLVSSVVTRYATHYMDVPAGQNAIVAVTSFSGYDIEDAIIMNRASIDRGYGRCMVMKTDESRIDKEKEQLYGFPLEMEQQRKQRSKNPENYNEFQTPLEQNDQFKQTGEYFKNPDKYRIGEKFQSMHAIDIDGLPKIGSKLENLDVIVSKSCLVDPQPEKSGSKIHLGLAQVTVVDKVLVTRIDKENCVRVGYREYRLPYYGDKFSSRHGQKGTVGLIVSQTDMPFSPITGIIPDQIMNPHGFPSRMTIGKMLELLIGKCSVLQGKGADGSIFKQPKTEIICQTLLENGFNYHGKDILISGINGIPCKSYVFEGPIYYQRLRHMVNDKMHARSKGPVAFLTRQPLEGRSKDGGLRLGEMEKDCLIAYGASALLNERMVFSSDVYLTYVCQHCQLIQMKNWCQICQNGNFVVQVKLPYAVKLMSQELMAMGIVMKLKID